jgi:hypothetical protein
MLHLREVVFHEVRKLLTDTLHVEVVDHVLKEV